MVKYSKVLCDILKCSEYKRSGVSSSASMNEDVIFSSFDGCIYYVGKPIKKRVPFIKINEPFCDLFVPENKFNFVTLFLIGLYSKINKGITIDNKRFYSSDPDKIGDIYVKVFKEDQNCKLD